MQSSRTNVVERISTAVPREASIALPAAQSWGSHTSSTDTATGAASRARSHVVSVLFRTHRCHLLLVGLPGIGRTYAVQDLARQASSGEIPFLSSHKFRWIDCRHVNPEDSRACLESIFSSTVNEPQLVLCLDGIASLLRRTGGGSNRPLLCSLLDRPGLRVIGVMTPWEYADLGAGDAEMLRYFARVDLHEPDEVTAEAIAAQHAVEFAKAHDVAIAPELVRRTVRLTSHFLLNEYHPAKDINVLREACERLAFERLMQQSDRHTLELSDIAAVLHERTGIPAETLLGCGDETDFAAALAAAVVGQPNAVETAARELRLIKAGLADQRGVKAHADRAIFILTTNAGDRHIAQLAEAGKSEDEIAEAVRQTLSRIRLERSTQPVFPPQFLSRIRRIVVFRPLDEAAMIAIAQQACQRLIDQWRQKRETTIEIAPEVPEAIGRLAHQLNQASHQQEGGRVIQKLIDQLLQDGLQNRMVGSTPSQQRTGSLRVSLSHGTVDAISLAELRQRLQCERRNNRSDDEQETATRGAIDGTVP